MNNSPKTITSALEELSAELGISEADFGGELKIEGEDPAMVSPLGSSLVGSAVLYQGLVVAPHRLALGCRSKMVTVAPIIAVLDEEPKMRKALWNLAAVLDARHHGVTIPFDTGNDASQRQARDPARDSAPILSN